MWIVENAAYLGEQSVIKAIAGKLAPWDAYHLHARPHEKLAERATGATSGTPTRTPDKFVSETHRSTSQELAARSQYNPGYIILRVPEGARIWTRGARAEGPSTCGSRYGTSCKTIE